MEGVGGEWLWWLELMCASLLPLFFLPTLGEIIVKTLRTGFNSSAGCMWPLGLCLPPSGIWA